MLLQNPSDSTGKLQIGSATISKPFYSVRVPQWPGVEGGGGEKLKLSSVLDILVSLSWELYFVGGGGRNHRDFCGFLWISGKHTSRLYVSGGEYREFIGIVLRGLHKWNNVNKHLKQSWLCDMLYNIYVQYMYSIIYNVYIIVGLQVMYLSPWHSRTPGYVSITLA